MKWLALIIVLSGCSVSQQPAVVIEVPLSAGAQCYELPGTIRVSYYEKDAGDPLALKLGKAIVDFGLLDSLWNADN